MSNSVLVQFSQAVGKRSAIPWETLLPVFIEIILGCFAARGATAEQFRQQAANPGLLQRGQLRARLRQVVVDSGVPILRRVAAVTALENAIAAEIELVEQSSHSQDPWQQAIEEASLLA